VVQTYHPSNASKEHGIPAENRRLLNLKTKETGVIEKEDSDSVVQLKRCGKKGRKKDPTDN